MSERRLFRGSESLERAAQMSGESAVELLRDGDVAQLRLNRPPGNRFSLDLIRELHRLVQSLHDDSSVRSVMLCAAVCVVRRVSSVGGTYTTRSAAGGGSGSGGGGSGGGRGRQRR